MAGRLRLARSSPKGGFGREFLAVGFDVIPIGLDLIARQEHGLASEAAFDGIERRLSFAFGRLGSGAFLRIGAMGGEAALAGGSFGIWYGASQAH